MKLKVNAKIVKLPFSYPFTISKGTKIHQEALIVELEYFGMKGYGEAPAIAYYGVTAQGMLEALEFKRRAVEQFSLTDPERFWHYLHHLFPNHPFLVCALDMAGWDVWGKLKQMPLHRLWGLNAEAMPVTDYTIGIDQPEVMLEKMQALPWPVYKIKVGFDGDIELIETLRKHTAQPFRVDANEAWQPNEAEEKIRRLASLNVELVEQPISKNNRDAQAALFKNTALPLIADESCVSEKDIKVCATDFHGVNIKLTKCSGITPARRMIREAKAKNLKVMLGCMNESTIGTAALLHLAPQADWLDADGPLLLNVHSGVPLIPVNGLYEMPVKPGLGVDVDFDQL